MKDQDIISMLGLESLPPEEKLQIIDQSAQLIEERLLIRLMKSLSETDLEMFKKLLEKGDSVEIDEFVGRAAPDYMFWMEEEITKVKEELSAMRDPEI